MRNSATIAYCLTPNPWCDFSHSRVTAKGNGCHKEKSHPRYGHSGGRCGIIGGMKANAERMRKIHVVLASDANYRPGLEVTMSTMRSACAEPERLEFHVYDDEALAGCEVGGMPLWNGSHMPYLRLWLPQLLRDVDWVIYSDVDTIWNRDVAELWDSVVGEAERGNAAAIYWVRDMASMVRVAGEWIGRVAAGEGIDFDWTRYACSGICVLNLAKLREIGFTARVLELYAKYGVPPFPDQDVLNVLLNRDGELLPSVWGAMGDPGNLPPTDARCVYHLTGVGRHFHDRTPPTYPPQYQLWWRIRRNEWSADGWSWGGRNRVLAALWPWRRMTRMLPLTWRERVVRQWFFAHVLISYRKNARSASAKTA